MQPTREYIRLVGVNATLKPSERLAMRSMSLPVYPVNIGGQSGTYRLRTFTQIA